MTWIIHFGLIVPAHAKVSGLLDPKGCWLAALQIKLARLLIVARDAMKPACVFRHDLFFTNNRACTFYESSKSSLVLTGGAFVRAKHSLSSAISVSQHASLSKRNHHAPSHSKCQRQNKVHLTGVLSHKDAGLQKVFRSHKSQKLDNRKKEQGFGGKRNVLFTPYEVLKMLYKVIDNV